MHRFVFAATIILISALFLLAQTKPNEKIAEQIKSLKAESLRELNYDKASDFTKILGFGSEFGKDQTRPNNLDSFSFGITFLIPETF